MAEEHTKCIINESTRRKRREENSKREKGQETEETREDITTHVDTETRTTGNKSGACVRGHTRTFKLVVVMVQLSTV